MHLDGTDSVTIVYVSFSARLPVLHNTTLTQQCYLGWYYVTASEAAQNFICVKELVKPDSVRISRPANC